MSKVAIIKGNPYEATVKALKLTNFKNFIKNKNKIVIKPNLVTTAKAEEGVTTDVNVVRAILDQIPDTEKVLIVEGSEPASESFKVNGYHELEKEYNVNILDLKGGEWLNVSVNKPLALKNVKISKIVFDSDFLISVAKLKIHRVAIVTGALKNLMGLCPLEQKIKIHAFIPKSIVDLLTVKFPDFGVIDGIVANEIDENIPHPIKMGVVLASKDCVSLDAVASEIMGVDSRKLFYIQKAEEKSFGIADLSKIEVIGSRIESVKKKFNLTSNLIGSSERMALKILLRTGTYEWSNRQILPYVRKIRRYLW